MNIEYTGDNLLYDKNFEEDIEFFEDNVKNYNEILTLDQLDLEFHSSFKSNNKQGVLGLVSNKKTKRKYVYKISQHIDFLMRHEYFVMKGLNSLRETIPHFCKTLALFRVKVPEDFKKSDNPFNTECCEEKTSGTSVLSTESRVKCIYTNVLLMEQIEGKKLYRYMKNDDINPEIIMSVIKQTLLATLIAGEKKKFSHYDMHSNNILIKKIKPNSVFLYIIDENRNYLIPTYGYCSTIIDYGFSYNKNCDDKNFCANLSHTDIGFISNLYDQHTDAKLFLTSVSREFKKFKRCDISKKLREIVVKIYNNCEVDLDCGWDNFTSNSISAQMLKKMSAQFKRSKFLKRQGYYVVELLQNLVVLPVKYKENNGDTVDELIGEFISEFLKIEKYISSDFYNIYIMREIIEATNRYRKEYITCGNNDEKRESIVIKYSKDITHAINNVVKYCNIKGINWEKMLCSLLCLSKCIDSFCNEKLRKLISYKKTNYNKIQLKGVTEIYEALESNIPSHFEFDNETSVYVFDCMEENAYKINKLDQNIINILNETHPFERGTLLYDHIKN